MLLIYTHKITPRIKYIFRHLFYNLLRTEINFTCDIEIFNKQDGYKISYGPTPIEDEPFFESHSLLFESKIRKDIQIEVERINDIPFFFKTSTKCLIGFDIFAASFYLLSRYEEYLNPLLDYQKRFNFSESIAYKYDFLQTPIIEVWVAELYKIIKNKFPHLPFQERKFKFTSLYCISQAWAYKGVNFLKGLVDLIKGINAQGLQSFYQRISVILGNKKDPFDHYDRIIEDNKKHPIKTIMLFLVREYDIYDDSLSIYNPRLQTLIKSMADHIKIGLYSSYISNRNPSLLEKEKNHIEEVLHYPIGKSAQSFGMLTIPKTYRMLIDIDIKEDYSMGYHDYKGFRAGTCNPFLFYDLENEITTSLKVFPISVSCLSWEEDFSTDKNFHEIITLLNKVKEMKGHFIFALSNQSLSRDSYWSEIYNKVLNSL